MNIEFNGHLTPKEIVSLANTFDRLQQENPDQCSRLFFDKIREKVNASLTSGTKSSPLPKHQKIQLLKSLAGACDHTLSQGKSKRSTSTAEKIHNLKQWCQKQLPPKKRKRVERFGPSSEAVITLYRQRPRWQANAKPKSPTTPGSVHLALLSSQSTTKRL